MGYKGVILIIMCSWHYVVNGQSTRDSVTATYPKPLVSQIELFAGGSFLYPKAAYSWPDEERNSKFGYTVGVGLSHQFNKVFQLAGLVSYDRKGFANSRRISPVYLVSEDVSNDYLTLSLIPMFTPKASRITFGVGPYYAFLTRSQLKGSYDSLNTTRHGYLKNSSELYKAYDFGLTITLTYSFELFHGRTFFFRMVNSAGLVSVNEPELVTISSIDRNRSVSLCLGILLNR